MNRSDRRKRDNRVKVSGKDQRDMMNRWDEDEETKSASMDRAKKDVKRKIRGEKDKGW